MKKNEKLDNAFALIKDRYFQLDNDYEQLELACKTEDEMNQLKQDYSTARDNYKKSLNLNFEVNNPTVDDLTDKLSKVEDRINNDIKNLGITSAIFNLISESVQIASSIIEVIMSLA